MTGAYTHRAFRLVSARRIFRRFTSYRMAFRLRRHVEHFMRWPGLLGPKEPALMEIAETLS